MIIETYPYVDENGTEHRELIKHESNREKMIMQVETGIEYYDAVDTYPCRYTYIETEKDRDPVIEEEEEMS